jgi:chromosome segregation ATPase
MTLTDQIYDELVNGLSEGVDWEHFLNKYGTSKGPLYNALGRLFQDVTAQIEALGEEKRKTQEELNESGLKLDSMNRRIKEAESIIEAKTQELSEAQEKKTSIERQIAGFESKLDEKTAFIKQIDELEGLCFNVDRLRQLKDLLAEIGARHGLKGTEAISRFFDALKDYDLRCGFEMEIQRLDTITETKRLEAEKWQAEAGRIEGQFKQFNEAINSTQALLKHGFKPEQIVSWHRILAGSGGVEAFAEGVNRYGSIEKLVVHEKREAKRLDTRLAEMNGKLNELKEHKAEIEGSIKVLRASANTEIEKVAQAGLETLRAQRAEMEGAIKTLKASVLNEMKDISQTGVDKIDKVAQAETNTLRQIGETALAELKRALSLVDSVSTRALEVGGILGQIESRLDKSKETKEKTAALIATVERGK